MDMDILDGSRPVLIIGKGYVSFQSLLEQKEEARKALAGTPCGTCDNCICINNRVRRDGLQVGCNLTPTKFKDPPTKCGEHESV